MECESCHQGHNANYGSGRFCNVRCARSFSTKSKRKEINERVSKTLTKANVNIKLCLECLNEFQARRNQRCCSMSCSRKYRYRDVEKRQVLIEQLLKVRKPWKSRKALTPSFPEQCIMQWLDELNFTYEREMPFQKWFIDFVIHDKKIAIEVDGRQHGYPEQQRRDREKDEALIKDGWQVIRISWKRLTKQSRLNIINILRAIA